MSVKKKCYKTQGGVQVEVTRKETTEQEINVIIKELDQIKGGVFASNYEYPGRYSRWEIVFKEPCIEIRGFQRNFLIQALRPQGGSLIAFLEKELKKVEQVKMIKKTKGYLYGEVLENQFVAEEEQRSKQGSLFTIIRTILHMFSSKEDDKLGLYGAIGYDIVFQFESEVELKKEREKNQENLVLFLPETLYVKDQKYDSMYQLDYKFDIPGSEENRLTEEELKENCFEQKGYKVQIPSSKPGEYAKIVSKAKESFRVGDLFEVVPSHVLSKEITLTAYEVYQNMIKINPSPYNFLLNLGKEHLIGSSPEMFVRVEGNIVETCPISGTIKRGINAIEDAEKIRTLLNSGKDEAELTMCTDVDRNDKSRICIPGSVQVVGRRQVELYSHLIHTVDHVKGIMRKEFDGIDAFLTHMWAVTITGAPKKAAIQWIEKEEKIPRTWYGGAVGFFQFNGDVNTGLTLRTVRLRDQIAQIRVGATLLMDSIPEEEEKETLTKAAALLESIKAPKEREIKEPVVVEKICKNKRILLIDHEDSFVHTLANYIRQLGGEVHTLRYHLAKERLKEEGFYDAVVLSPGPGTPSSFGLNETIKLCLNKQIPILGICLGLQGVVEYFGGDLDVLPKVRHGVKKRVTLIEREIKTNLPKEIEVGLYHSLYAKTIPTCLRITAIDEEQIIMGIRHEQLPIVAVQFHPESILSIKEEQGLQLLHNLFSIILE